MNDDIETLPRREPCFTELLEVLACRKPTRPVLYDLYLNNALYSMASGDDLTTARSSVEQVRIIAKAFARLGYDYAAPWPNTLCDFAFTKGDRSRLATISQNEHPLITDRASFEQYAWPSPNTCRFLSEDEVAAILPGGMKLVTFAPDSGVFETAVALSGAENLGLMIHDDPPLAQALFTEIGSRLVAVIDRLAGHAYMGAVVVTDDWGYKTGSFFSPAMLRHYVFPWHARIVERIHCRGKPAILHSCGNPAQIMDDVIDVIRYDGRHSYEDGIIPVEDAYRRWGGRIATLGGLDMDFFCSARPEDVYRRARALLATARDRGGYALGTGNSVPDFLPRLNYLAMLRAALED
jgi:uroporphyrinogen decarboxylase